MTALPFRACSAIRRLLAAACTLRRCRGGCQQSLHGHAVGQDWQLAIRDRFGELQTAGLHHWRHSFAVSAIIARRSRTARCTLAPESARASDNSSSTRDEVLSASRRMWRKASRYSASPLDLRRAISASVRMREMGVRSSCEASAVNWFTRRKRAFDSCQHFVQRLRQALEFIAGREFFQPFA